MKLNSAEMKSYIKNPKERRSIIMKAVVSDYGSVFEAVKAILGVTLFTSTNLTKENAETTHGYQYVQKRGSENKVFSLKHGDEGFVGNSGCLFSLLGCFYGYRDKEAVIQGYKLVEQHYNIPMWLVGAESRNKGEDYLLSKYGSYLAAGQSLTGLNLYKCPVKTGQRWEETQGYRLLDDKGDFAVVHLTEGYVAPAKDVFANIGACLGARGRDASQRGWDAVFEDVIGSGDILVDTEEVRRKQAEWQAERDADEAETFAKNKEKSLGIFERCLPDEEAHAIYAEYISKGREQSHFENTGLSPNIKVVHDLEYYCKGDDKNNGRKMTAIIMPLLKLENGQYKIRMLHSIYIEKINGVWSKADVKMAKQDVGKFNNETGMLSSICLMDNPILYAGEGNETVSSYYGAMTQRYGVSPADFKCSHTASRLKGAEIEGYKKVRLLVDRDRSGTGMWSCMCKRYELEDSGVEVELMMPPSTKVPIYIYYKPGSDATTLEECIEECQFWRDVDADFKAYWESSGQQYKSRYEAFVVIPDKCTEEINVNYPHIIRESDIDINVVPKGVDWDHVLKISPDIAFELEDFYQTSGDVNAA
tara:strand:- start:13179 stop:14945 length:1767 start_codon:yes stop_codon:yes gene_type:complete